MTRIVVQADVADQIRRAHGQIELIDDQGKRIGIVRRPPSEDEIQFAMSRIGNNGPKSTIDEVIARIESL